MSETTKPSLTHGWHESRTQGKMQLTGLVGAAQGAVSDRMSSGGLQAIVALAVALGLLIVFPVCRAVLSPQRKVPGPFLARFTNLWYLWRLYEGHFEEENLALHERYGNRSPRPWTSNPKLTAHRPHCSPRPEPLLLCRSRRPEGHIRARCRQSLSQVSVVPACGGSGEVDPLRRRGHCPSCQAPAALSEHVLHVVPGNVRGLRGRMRRLVRPAPL